MTNSSDSGSELGGPLLEQIFELWLKPELRRRNLSLARHGVTKALVVMPPGRKIQVRINDEAVFIAKARVTRPVGEGEPLFAQDIDALQDLRPHEIDPDAGWVGFVLIQGIYRIAFDFRRNKARAAALLARAQEFAVTAREALGRKHLGPSIENAFAAAELAVLAQMYLIEDKPSRNHVQRRRWWRNWTELGNAPSDQGEALARLGALRGAARYGEGKLAVSPGEAQSLLNTVGEMIAHALAQSGAASD